MREKLFGDEFHKDELFEKIKSYAEQLTIWDKRIIEIVGIGNITKEVIEPSDLVELICIFDVVPESETQGFFSITNLIVRDEFETGSELLGITNAINLGFEINGKYYLPNGKIIDSPKNQVTIWRRNNERDFDK